METIVEDGRESEKVTLAPKEHVKPMTQGPVIGLPNPGQKSIL